MAITYYIINENSVFNLINLKEISKITKVEIKLFGFIKLFKILKNICNSKSNLMLGISIIMIE